MVRKCTRFLLFILTGFVLLAASAVPAQTRFVVLREFDAPEARQAVAVDSCCFYAIDNRTIAKYDKRTGELLNRWSGPKGGPIHHLNSGVVIGHRLFCAHSNYPHVPMTSSVEIWDTETMEHVANHSFGIYEGSATWVDFHNGSWWVVFANYNTRGGQPGKGPEWTTLVRFDTNWVRQEAWVFPDTLIERFRPYSNSGGAWGPDGLLYCTGHSRRELYVLDLPTAGSVLRLLRILPFASPGQGIAWDRSEPGVLYSIDRKRRKVVVSRLE